MALCRQCGDRAGYGRELCELCDIAKRDNTAAVADETRSISQPWQTPKKMRRAGTGRTTPPATPGPLANVPPLLAAGGGLLALGLIGIILALVIDTSVETTSYYGTASRVNNIGLMNDRLAYLAAAGVAAVIGAILVVASMKRP